MAVVKWVSGDTSPNINFALVQNDGTTPYVLTGATVRFRIADPDTLVETNSNSTNSCTIVSATGGTCYYAPNSTDTPDPKNYTCDIEITLASTKVTTPFEQVILAVREKN